MSAPAVRKKLIYVSLSATGTVLLLREAHDLLAVGEQGGNRWKRASRSSKHLYDGRSPHCRRTM